MIIEAKEYILNGRKIVLRNATPSDAQILIEYLETVCGETKFLMCEPDEIHYTVEQEVEFINSYNASEDSMMLLAFVDGAYARNCSFASKSTCRRAKHRAEIGIALYQKYTGFGLGKLMMKCLLEEIASLGYEQAELTVVSGNERAYQLYKSLGFEECGRIPKANKYDDGTYSDDILMVTTV